MGLDGTLQTDRVDDRAGRPETGRLRSPHVEGDLALMFDNLRGFEREMADANGSFELFGLFRRDGATRWDLVVAAPWLCGDVRQNIEQIYGPLAAAAGPDVLMTVSRIIVLTDRDRFLSAMRSLPAVEHGCEPVPAGDYEGVEVAEGFLFTNTLPVRAAA